MSQRLFATLLAPVAGALLLTLAAPASASAQISYGYYPAQPVPSTGFMPGRYYQTGPNSLYNPQTGSSYLPGQAVYKPSGVYSPVGNGYYQNPLTGNVYNPTTGAYKTRR